MSIILGFVGQMASGKGTAAAYLQRTHGATTFRFSTALRDVLDRLYLPQTRGNLQTLSQMLREGFDQELLSRVIAEDVRSADAPLIVIDGIRRTPDLARLSALEGFVLVHITADMQTRFERITQRTENVDDQSKTFAEFAQQHQAEAEIQIATIATQAQQVIDNNGSLEDLERQLDALVQTHDTGSKQPDVSQVA